MELSPKARYILALMWFFIGSKVICQLKVIDALSASPPNIILVLTDDQDVVLNGMVNIETIVESFENTWMNGNMMRI